MNKAKRRAQKRENFRKSMANKDNPGGLFDVDANTRQMKANFVTKISKIFFLMIMHLIQWRKH